MSNANLITEKDGSLKFDKDDPQLFYDRSRASGFELLKTLVSLSTAAVGAFFFALTRDTGQKVSEYEHNTVILALGFMVAAVFTGLLGWAADAKFYDYWASSLEKNRTEKQKTSSNKKRRFANDVRRIFIFLLTIFFALGVLTSAIYLYCRLDPNL